MIALAILSVIACASASQRFPPKYAELGSWQSLVTSSYKREITLRDVFERPVIILSEAGAQDNKTFSAFYAKYGLGSVQSNSSFKPLYSSLRRHSDVLGLVFSTDSFPFIPLFLHYNVGSLVFPDNFRVEDLIEFAQEDLLILYVASEEDFNQCSFPSISKIGTFSINNQSIVPLSQASQSSYPPKILPFFFVSPSFNYQHLFQKPVVQWQLPQKPVLQLQLPQKPVLQLQLPQKPVVQWQLPQKPVLQLQLPQKPVLQLQLPQKPYLVAAWKPHHKFGDKINHSEPAKNVSSSYNSTASANGQVNSSHTPISGVNDSSPSSPSSSYRDNPPPSSSNAPSSDAPSSNAPGLV